MAVHPASVVKGASPQTHFASQPVLPKYIWPTKTSPDWLGIIDDATALLGGTAAGEKLTSDANHHGQQDFSKTGTVRSIVKTFKPYLLYSRVSDISDS